jgi:hypothetical protein
MRIFLIPFGDDARNVVGELVEAALSLRVEAVVGLQKLGRNPLRMLA